MRQIVLDTETTGISWKNGHKIIEIGCVELIDRRMTGNDYHVYINPQRAVDPGAFAVHGLSESFLQDKPVFSQIVDEFLEYAKDSELLIHNASFDIGFLDYELKCWNGKIKKMKAICDVLDTLALAREQHPGVRNSLDALCKRYHVDNSNRNLHGALLDAHLLTQVYLGMTGGQGSLFSSDEKDGATHTASKPVNASLEKQWDILTIAPRPDELQAHQDYLKQMSTSGECVWDEKS